MRLEAESRCPEGLIHAGSDAFLVACLTAFARHLPLALNPDHIWAVIAYGFAKHVDKNAEVTRVKGSLHREPWVPTKDYPLNIHPEFGA